MVNNCLKLVTTSLMGIVGLGIGLLGGSQVAKAVDLAKGFDYFITFGDGTSSIVLPNIGIVDLIGTPFDPAISQADTKLERLEDCTFIEGSCTVPLIIHELNLQSVNTVDLSPYGLEPSVVLIRLYGAQVPGYITINESPKTWYANLPIIAYAELPDDTIIEVPGFGPLIFYATADEGELIGSGTYTTLDSFDALGIFTGPLITDPSLSAPHPQEIHAMTPLDITSTSVPESSTIMPLAILGLIGLWSLKDNNSI